MHRILTSGLLEFLYAFYLLSGFAKGFMIAYGLQIPIDITLFTALFLLVFILIVLYKYYEIPRHYVVAILLLFIFYTWIIFSTLYTSSNSYYLHKTLYFLTNILAFIFPVFLYRYFHINKFFKYFISLSTGFNIFFIVFILPYIYTVPSYYEIAGSYLFVSLYSGMNILLFLILKLKYQSTYLTYSILIINFYTLMTSGGRAGIIFTFFLLILYYLSKINVSKILQIHVKKVFKYFLLIITLSLAGLTYFSINNSANSNAEKLQLLDRTVNRLILLSKSTGGEDTGQSMNVRYELMTFSVDKIFDNTPHFLFGYGVGSFSMEYLNEDKRGYPHNIILEILLELGIIGLIFFLIFYIYIIKGYKYTLVSWLVFYMTLNVLKSSGLTDLRLFFAILSLMIISITYKTDIHEKPYNYKNKTKELQ